MKMKRKLLAVGMLVILSMAAFAQSEDDFDISQNKGGGITITKYLGEVKDVAVPATISGLKVTEIGDGAFSNANYWGQPLGAGIASLTLPEGLLKIGNNAFLMNKSLQSVVIPDSVTEIGEAAFRSCGLTQLTLGNKVQTIGSFAFEGNQLTEVILPASLKQISTGTFGYNQIQSLTIPNHITSIGVGAFQNNPLVTLVIVPPVLAAYDWTKETGIRERAFDKSTSTLTRITLPANFVFMTAGEPLGFEQSFIDFYTSQDKKAGTYVKRGRIWVKE